MVEILYYYILIYEKIKKIWYNFFGKLYKIRFSILVNFFIFYMCYVFLIDFFDDGSFGVV